MGSIGAILETLSIGGKENPSLEEKVEKILDGMSKNASVLLPGATDFEESMSRWSKAAERVPEFIIRPSTASDVSKALLFCIKNKAEFGVCCGGHSTSASSSTEGVLISLDSMRGVTVNEENKTVTAQGGARWSDVNLEAEKHGLACVSGTVDHTGVAGLTLGGGYGFMTGEHGLVLDNLLSAEVVLANGSIVTASSIDNPDLFWALRGAGYKFGIVTSFTYQGHEQKRDVWGGIMVLTPDKKDKVLEFGHTYFPNPDPKSTWVLGFTTMGGNTIMMVGLYYNGPEEVGKNIFKPLLELEPIMSDIRLRSMRDMNYILNEHFPPGLRRVMKGAAYFPPLTLDYVQRDVDALEKLVKETPDAGASVIIYEYVPWEKIVAVGQTETAFANRGAYCNVLYAGGWTLPDNDDVCRKWTRAMGHKAHEEFDAVVAKLGSEAETGVGEYANYDGAMSGGNVVFGRNYPRLLELKARYDPKNVFKHGPDLTAKA